MRWFNPKIIVRSGIRTHAWRTRLRPERSALECDVLTQKILSEVGFEPTPGEPDCDLNAAP